MTDSLDSTRLTDRVAALVEAARKAGADAADAVAVRGRSSSVTVRQGKVEKTEASESDDMSLRVFVGKRVASVSATAASDPKVLAERAVAMAKVAPEDPYQGLADPALLVKEPKDLDLFDPAEIGAERMKADALAMEGAALAVPGVTNSSGSSASAGFGGLVLATSTGFVAQYVASRFSRSVSVIAGEGTGMERDYDYSAVRHRADLADPDDIGRSAGERAIRRLNPRKVDTRKVPVVFDPRTAGSFPSYLASAANGQSVARKTSFLREKLGQRVFREGVRIVDDPLRRRGLRSRPFDGEGVAARPLILVEDGILASWLLDTATAAELGLKTTGHASRGTGGPPSPGPTNLHLAAGTASPAEMIAAIKDGLYVTDMIGSGVNMVTGDYSRGCSGYWIENGALAYPVAEITIAGNLVDMFANLTPASDLVFRYGTDAPTVLIEGLTVAGR